MQLHFYYSHITVVPVGVIVGLQDTEYTVLESVSPLHICAEILSDVRCNVAFEFAVTFSTVDNSAGNPMEILLVLYVTFLL